jgi:hypothetical protein
LVGLLFFVSYLYSPPSGEKNLTEESLSAENIETTAVSIGGAILNATISDTEEERNLGLSGRGSLPPGEGMLFVFDYPDFQGFWMQDMKFPIDIIWVDENKKIIYAKEDATPESYPEIFQPEELALYVLEVSAGFFSEHKIKIGDTVEFSLPVKN